MVYCQECGSEITNVDTFCPFCGISLQSGIKDSDATTDNEDVEMSSDDLNDHSEEPIDMSETIVADPSTYPDVPDKPADSGYIDISTLKAEDQVAEADNDTSQEDSELIEASEDKQKSNDLELGSTGEIANDVAIDSTDAEVLEDEPDLDVSDNQDDIKELLTDDSDEEDVIDSKEFFGDEKESDQLKSDKKAVEVVTETVEQANAEASTDSSDLAVESSDDISSEVINSNSDVQDAATDLNAEPLKEVRTDASKIHKTPSEIKSADDSEIEEAVSVIDSKANAWKENGENLTTDSINEEVSNTESEKKAELDSVYHETKSEPDTEVDGVKIEENIKDTPIELETETIEEEESVSEESEKESILESDINSPAEKTSDSLDSENSEIPTPEIIKNEESSIESGEADHVEMESEIVDAELHNTNSGEEKLDQSSTEQNENELKEKSSEPATVSQTTPNIGVSDTDGSKSQKLKPLDEGVVLNNRYEIVRKIGGGGMGAVYLANDKNLGGVLRAVKEMVQSYIEEEQQEKAIQDFKRESTLLTSLDHQSIPTIYDYFYDEKEARFYLVMKYISGGDLAARLRAAPEGRLDEISVTSWALQIADVLNYLHSKNPPIVYRDLKPANIMIDGNNDKVMLIDFGIARWINKEEKGVTAVGTMGYAPPELFSGNVEPSSDIYSLGSTMFHLLTGADPQNNPLLIFDFQKHPRPRQINPQLSDQMERILMRSVEYNADKRFNSAAEMRNSLKEHLDNLTAGNVSFGIKETPTAVALSDQPVYCGFCGQKIVATDMFCAFCGAKQPLAQPGVHSQEYHIPATTAKLVIDGTSELEYQPFDLVKNDNLVGRRDPMSNIFPEVDLSKFDPQTKISRKHARIWRDGDNFLIEDLGSSNGTTYISSTNEELKLMPKQTQILKNGDKIQVGDTTLQFMVG